MPANDVWVVTTPDGSTIPMPVIADVVKHVNIEERCITVELLPGLREITSTSGDDSDE